MTPFSLLLRRTVIVNTTTESFRGVLWKKRGPLIVLRNAVLLEMGKEPNPLDGEIVIERREISFYQVLA